MIGLTAKIALKGATASFDKLYTYNIPKKLETRAVSGCRVILPFGKGNLKKQGMIFAVENAETDGLKSIISVTDREPVLTSEMLSLCAYMRENYFCTYYEAVHAVLPAGLSFKMISYYSANENFLSESLLDENEKAIFDFLKEKGEKEEERLKKLFGATEELLEGLTEKQAIFKNRDLKRRINDASERYVRAAQPDESDDSSFTARQREILGFVREAGSVGIKEIRYYTGVSISVIDKLIKCGALISFEKPVFRTQTEDFVKTEQKKIILTEEQKIAYNGISTEYDRKNGSVSLLYGITGSGKTQVFLKLADKVSAEGRGVIVTVPEISLTPQMLDIFKSRYGNKVAIFHSAMSMGKRMDEWKRVKSGDALIALGTRSAVFAPFSNLGLVIIDEEHEHTYKSEQSPRFHARDIAKFRVKQSGGLLCLSSATPSVESFTAAKSGKYSLFELKARYGNAVLPSVETVDMKKEILSGNSSPISRRLYEEMKRTLSCGNQVILLLNRRGRSTYVSCPDCGYVMTCPNCSISLTYHSANNRMMCHYCGYSVQNDGKCPECGGEHMKFFGVGTQKAEDELKKLFPENRVLRLDADSTLARDSYSEYLNAFARGEYDILLGTQMVAKGLNFPNVTLVGVLGADAAMYSEDFRSYERTFSLLTQVVGRAGRGEKAGLAVVQTINPDSSVIALAEKQDYEGFYNEEIMTRRLMVYPPYCDICVICARSADRQAAQNAVNGIFEAIKEMISVEYTDVKVIILGPAPATVVKVYNKYRYRMIIKCRNNGRFRDVLRKALDIKLSGDVSVSVDMNPETVI